MCKAMERIEARGEIFLPWSVCGRALLPMSLKYFHSVVVAALLAGCHALITTAPIVEHCDKCMPDGVYEVKLKGLEKVPIRLSVAHDMTNSIYKVDAGEHGCFQALCKQEGKDQVLFSFTLSDNAMKKAMRALTESEMLFLSKKYVTGRLSKKADGCEIWILTKSENMSAACFVSEPLERLLSMIPSTNAPPFACAGTLRQLED